MNVLVSGSHGLIGSPLLDRLGEQGHRVVVLARPQGPDDHRWPAVHWDPRAGTIDRGALERTGPHDAVVHLAGAGIADRRWTPSRLAQLERSRIGATELLVSALGDLPRPPATLVSASGVNYYGDRGDEVLTEESGSGTGFLAGLCREWEAAAEAATASGTRVVTLRSGIVLAPGGGILGRMLLPFRLGLGARLGSGRQYVSWITLEDELRVIEQALVDESLAGPVNATAPEPVTNAELTRALAREVRRPALLALPRPVLEAALGRGIAGELLLSSLRVVPARLERSGFRFVRANLATALAGMLGRDPRTAAR